MRETIFRLNDIRGEIDCDMTVNDMAYVAAGIVRYIMSRDSTLRTVACARDGRIHSPAIFEIVTRVCSEHGLVVYDLGICATPVVQFMLHKMPIDFAIMITASHNGPTYNGCKIFYKQRIVCGEDLQRIRALAYEIRVSQTHYQPVETRAELRSCAAVDRYVAWLCEHFSHLKGWQRRIIFDCGSGATGAIIPQLITAMGWANAQALYAEIDGNFPYHEADPVVPENMRDLAYNVVESQALCGIGFDGDGDRVGLVTAKGHHVRGDRLLALFAHAVLQSSPHSAVVFDAKCSDMVPNIIREQQGIPYYSPSGHSRIRQKMDETEAVFGGELSCHFFFADHYFGYDDGIYAALRLIDLLYKKSCSLEEALACVPRTYGTEEWRIAYPDEHKWGVVTRLQNDALACSQVQEISLLDGVRMTTCYGWVLLRASHTQPALCLRSEAYSRDDVIPLGNVVKSLLQPYELWKSLESSFDTWIETAYMHDRPLV